MKIFIGYDKREAIAYHVCSNSLIRHSTGPLEIVPLALNNLKTFYGEEHKDGSNDFIYSRFLVPYLCGFTGTALFMDGDMVVLDDVSKLFELADPRMAVQVVKHEYKTKAEKKYLGSINENYPCKNWSSVILWNCNHFANRKLTPDNVAKMTGPQLHRFTWIEPDRIGELPIEWNWLESEYPINPEAKLIHYTLGTPCWSEYSNTPMSDKWHVELKEALNVDNGSILGMCDRACLT